MLFWNVVRACPQFLVLAFAFALAACGANNPSPTGKSGNPSEDLVKTACPGDSDIIKGSASQWQMTYSWLAGPKSIAEDVFESRLCLNFRSAAGKLPLSVSDIKVVAWMPSMGHDTGNEQPQSTVGSKGIVNVNNIYFTMAGAWSIIVTANVDGVSDRAEFPVTLTE